MLDRYIPFVRNLLCKYRRNGIPIEIEEFRTVVLPKRKKWIEHFWLRLISWKIKIKICAGKNFRSEMQLTSPIVMCQHVVYLIRRTSAQHLMFRSKSASHIISAPRAYSSVPNKSGAALILLEAKLQSTCLFQFLVKKCVKCAWMIEKLILHIICIYVIKHAIKNPINSFVWCNTRVSAQGVKSLGVHFACLSRGFEFYEVKKNCY